MKDKHHHGEKHSHSPHHHHHHHRDDASKSKHKSHGHHHGHSSHHHSSSSRPDAAETKAHVFKTHSRKDQKAHQNQAHKKEHAAKKQKQQKELLKLDDLEPRKRKLSQNTVKHLKPLRRSSFQRLYGSTGDPAAEATRAHYAAQANAKIRGFLSEQDGDNYCDFVRESIEGSHSSKAASAASAAYERRERKRQSEGFCMWLFDACVAVMCSFCWMCPRDGPGGASRGRQHAGGYHHEHHNLEAQHRHENSSHHGRRIHHGR